MGQEPAKISKKALKEFLSEAEEIGEKLYQDLDRFVESVKGGKADQDALNALFRGAHSLKGISGMFGFPVLSQLSHNMENLLDGLRLGKVKIEARVLDLFSEGIDLLHRILEAKEEGRKEKDQVEAFIAKLHRVAKEQATESDTSPLSSLEMDKNLLSVLTEYEEHRLMENVRAGAHLFTVQATFDLMSFDRDLAELTEILKKEGEIITTLPSSGTHGAGQIHFDILLGTDKLRGDLEKAIEIKGVEVIPIPVRPSGESSPVRQPGIPVEGGQEIRPQSVPGLPAEEGHPLQEAAPSAMDVSLKSVSQTVRVDISKLDNIMNIVGELVLSRTEISKIAENLRAQLGFTGPAVDLFKAARDLERKLNELQDGVMDVRMVPLRQVFDKLARTVRKLTKETGKDADLEIFGADTELDKLIIEELGDPLMHIIRNAIDHGIESIQERLLKGKPARGKIILNAYQKGNHVILEVGDDGRGIDPAQVLTAAVTRGLAEEGARLSQEEIFELLFTPGFSTKKEISEISGRGVGLDVVKNNISRLSGMIEVESGVGQGTTFRLTLPITLAIIQALIIETCGRSYAIPLNSIMESIMIQASRIETIEGKEVVELRGHTLPLLRLGDYFHLSRRESPLETFYVVVIGLAEKRLGIIVEKLSGQQDVVIKSMGEGLKKVKGIAGAADVGSRKTILVLDVSAIIQEISEKAVRA